MRSSRFFLASLAGGSLFLAGVTASQATTDYRYTYVSLTPNFPRATPSSILSRLATMAVSMVTPIAAHQADVCHPLQSASATRSRC